MCLVVSLRKSGEQTLALDAPEDSWWWPCMRWRTMSPDWCLMRWMLKQLPWPDYLPFLQDTYMYLLILGSSLIGRVCKCKVHLQHTPNVLFRKFRKSDSNLWYGLFDINMLGLRNNPSILSPERKRQNEVTGWDPTVEIRNMQHLIYGFVTVKNTCFLLKSYCHPLLGLGFWQLKGHLASGYAKCHIVTAPLC